MDGTTSRLLERLNDAVADVCDWPFPEDSAVDVVGEVQRLERRLTDFRRMLVSELPAGVEGDVYRVEERNSASRTYNTNGILAAFTGAIEEGPEQALSDLLMERAVELKWRWTQLQRAANKYDVTLTIAHHEIEDGDPEALVGEVWKTVTSVKAKEVTP